MCIIIVKYPGTHVSRRKLRHSWDRNKDGAGFAFVSEEGELYIDKGYFQFHEFYKALRNAEAENPHSAFIIHMRIATHGLVDITNSHPHYVNDKLVMAHNGVLRCVNVPKDSTESDTILFNLNILSKLPEGWEKSEVICTLVQSFIGHGNKLAFLNSDNETLILNEQLGEWDEGCWYSNTSYKAPKLVTTTAGNNWNYYPNRGNITSISDYYKKCKNPGCGKNAKESEYDEETGHCL